MATEKILFIGGIDDLKEYDTTCFATDTYCHISFYNRKNGIKVKITIHFGVADNRYDFRPLCFIAYKRKHNGCKMVSGNGTHSGMYCWIDDRYRTCLEKIKKIRKIYHYNNTYPIFRNIFIGVIYVRYYILLLGNSDVFGFYFRWHSPCYRSSSSTFNCAGI